MSAPTPRRPSAILLLFVLLLVPALAGCAAQEGATDEGPGGERPPDNDSEKDNGEDESRNRADGGSEPEDDAPAIRGFDLALEPGTYWDFHAVEDKESFAQGSSPRKTRTTFIYRVALGEPGEIQGVRALKVHVTGSTPFSRTLTHLAAADHKLLGSWDGRTLHPIVDGQAGTWKGGGFFVGFPPDAPLQPTKGTDAGGAIYTVSVSGGEGGCEYSREAGQTICAGDDEWDSSNRESYRPGIGPTSYEGTFSYSSSGGGFYTASRSKTTARLVGTSLISPDGWEPQPVAWMPRTPMPTPRAFPVAAEVGGAIYVFGGQQAERDADGDLIHSPLGAVERYDPVVDRWEGRAAMPEAWFGDGEVYSLAAAALEDRVYLFGLGSLGSGQLVTRTFIYDTSKDSWSAGTAASAGIAFHRAATVGDRIYVFGPNAETQATEGYVYDPAADSWDYGPVVPEFISQFGMVTVGTDIYLVGGWDVAKKSPSARIHVYDTLLDGWTGMKPLETARSLPSVLSFDDKLYVFGGFDGTRILDSVEAFDWSSRTWTEAPSLPKPLVHAAAAASGGNGYLLGGRAEWAEGDTYGGNLADLHLDLAQVFVPGAPEA